MSSPRPFGTSGEKSREKRTATAKPPEAACTSPLRVTVTFAGITTQPAKTTVNTARSPTANARVSELGLIRIGPSVPPLAPAADARCPRLQGPFPGLRSAAEPGVATCTRPIRTCMLPMCSLNIAITEALGTYKRAGALSLPLPREGGLSAPLRCWHHEQGQSALPSLACRGGRPPRRSREDPLLPRPGRGVPLRAARVTKSETSLPRPSSPFPRTSFSHSA